jgi:enoyl-[acyl-carrier protein] reductase II
MIRTPVCGLFGLRYPIFQGGMAWISDAALAGAVSNAGGLGIISAMNAGPDYLRGQIAQCRALLADPALPFGVNIMLMSPFADQVAQVVIDEKVPVVVTGAGMPSKYMQAWVDAGIRVVPVVPSTAIAKMVARMGACAVVAEGGESGGHVGDLTTMTLVPQVVDAVDIPVIAAGGIADGRGIAAALMLGAQGVQCGTRFLTANECGVHPNYKEKILKARDIDTIVTGKRLGHPVRSLKNQFSRRFYEMEYDAALTDEQIGAFGAGSLRHAAVDGDVQNGSVMAGQCAAMIHDEAPAAQIIRTMFDQAQEILNGAGRFLDKEQL